MARCGFATGIVDGGNATAVPSIESGFDVMINLRGLAADRRPDGARAATDETLAPAALSVPEVADALGHLFGFITVTARAAETLLPPPHPENARAAVWVSVRGGLANRVIDLRAFRQIPRSTGISQAFDGFQLDLADGSQVPDDAVREFVANLLYEGLERGGYRDLGEAIDALRIGTTDR
jgi:hypothetical protein